MAEPKSSKRCERSQGNVESPIDSALSRFLERRLKPGERICVGFSGGMDSVVLLHALNRLAIEQDRAIGLSALHVHHGLSECADDWARFCEDFCHRCGVPLEIVRVAVPRDSGEGLEGAARRLRHGVFAACRADWLGLAHHRDDQAETVLLNLLRGAGVAGAAGMLVERPQLRGPTLVRPLLDVPRLAIERYAAEHGLSWIDDESNADRRFRRNFLRHEILPRLETTFSGAGKSLARAAGHFAEAAGLLDDLAGIDREAASAASGRIALVALNELPQARARNLLRHVWTAAGFQAPDTRWIDEALKQLATADALSELRVATAEAALHVYRGELYLVRLSGGPPAEPLSWSGQDILPWAGGSRAIPCGDGSWNRSWTPGRCGGRAQGQAGGRTPAAGCAASAPEPAQFAAGSGGAAMGAPESADALGKRAIGLGGRDRLRRGVCLPAGRGGGSSSMGEHDRRLSPALGKRPAELSDHAGEIVGQGGA